MALWLVRAGSQGEREEFALERNLAVIGWDDLPDLSVVTDRKILLQLLSARYPGQKQKTLMNWESQIWPFVREIAVGDLVALPLKRRATIAIGTVSGNYEYQPENPPDARHTRAVEWLKEIPRSEFNQNQRWSMGAFMTVCRLRRHNLEETVRAFLGGKQPPPQEETDGQQLEIDLLPNLQETADNQIREHISSNFKSHELERLVGAVLAAKGYKVERTAKSGDGGVDLVAGSGPMGFDPPRIAVQVKSGETAIDVKVLRELKGVLKDFGADHGLIVAWAGFKGSFDKEALRHFFEIRLWTGDDLIREIQGTYDSLPETIRAELPLKRIWTLVSEDE